MPSRKNPTSAAVKETIGRTKDAIEIAVQRDRCAFPTLSASARRGVALGLLAGPFVFRSAQTRSRVTQPEEAFYCIQSHLVPSDTQVSYALNPDPLLGGVSGMITGSPTLWRGEAHRRLHGEGCQRQSACHCESDGFPLNQLRDGVMKAPTAMFCVVGSGHVAFLGAVSKERTFRGFPQQGIPLIRA